MINKKIIFVLVLISLFSFCTSYLPEFKTAENAYLIGDYKKAYDYYKQALEQDPLNEKYKLGFLKAKNALINSYIERANYYFKRGNRKKASEFLEKALEIDPNNNYIRSNLEKIESRGREPEKKVKPEVIPGEEEKENLINVKFKDAPVSEIIKSIAKSGGYNVVFDKDFKDNTYSIELTNKRWHDVLDILCIATKSFYTKIDPNTIIVAPDNLMSRKQYQKDQVKTYYLYEANGKNLIQTLSRIARGKIILNYFEDINAIVARGSPSELNFMGELITRLDKAKDQVMIDINIMEVNKTILNDIGLDLFSSQSGIGLSFFDSENDEGTGSSTFSINQLTDIDKSNIYLTIPQSALKVLESSGYTKILARPKIVGMEGEQLTFKIGEKFPLPNTSFQAMAAGGVTNVPLTSYDYKDVGLNFEVTPFVHRGGEVSLKIKIEVSSIGATGYKDIPSIRNREIEVNLRLKEGQTNILAGLLQEEEKKTLAGVIGLSKIPLIGKLFGNTNKTVSQNDIIFTITPYIVKKLKVSSTDEQAIDVDKDETLSGGSNYPGIQKERGSGEMERTSIPKGNDVLYIPGRIYMRQDNPYNLVLSGRVSKKVKKANISIAFDPEYLNVQSIQKRNPQTLPHYDNDAGEIIIGVTFGENTTGVINLGAIKFEPRKKGTTTLNITNLEIQATDGSILSMQFNESVNITIK